MRQQGQLKRVDRTACVKDKFLEFFRDFKKCCRIKFYFLPLKTSLVEQKLSCLQKDGEVSVAL
jgi:hypothetical protein